MSPEDHAQVAVWVWKPGKEITAHRSLGLRQEAWAGAVDPRLRNFGHMSEGLRGRL